MYISNRTSGNLGENFMAHRKYTYELKKEIVEQYFEGYTGEQLAEKYNLSHRSRVYDWVKEVREAGTMDVLQPHKGRVKEKLTKEKKLTLAEENERLRLENMYLKKLLELRKG